jgi:hypothetical protein
MTEGLKSTPPRRAEKALRTRKKYQKLFLKPAMAAISNYLCAQAMT